jgi:uncharacterized delta-60 repeat protein
MKKKNRTQNWILCAAALAMGILSQTKVHAQGAVEAWVQRYGNPTEANEYAKKVVTDSEGNIIVAGYTSPDISGYDWLIIKYSSSGAALWTNHYNGSVNSFDVANALAVDGSGNVFVTGYSLSGGSSYDYTTIKYSGEGVPLWTNLYNGPGNNSDLAYAIALDGSGNVFVTGYSYGTNSYSDYATIKYSNAGVALWTNRYNGPGNDDDRPNALGVDPNGNIFVTGYSYGSSSGFDYTTIKYSNAGAVLWTNRYNGPGNGSDQASAMAVDTNGNVFVTGYSYGNSSSSDYATIKYSDAGVALWTNRYNGPGNSSDQASAMAVDTSGNVFVTGYSYGSSGNDDYTTIRYSNAGVALWTNRYNGPANIRDQANAIAVDTNGNVFITGYSYGTNGYSDYATIKYSNAGVALWTNRYNGPGNDDEAKAVAIDLNGNVFVTGQSQSGEGSYDYATIRYSNDGIPLWTNRLNEPGDSANVPQAVAVDRNGNMFVGGSSRGQSSGDDYLLIKYSVEGLPLWTNRYNGFGHGASDSAQAIAVDGSGDVLVTGGIRNDQSSSLYATIKYSGAGVLLWTNIYYNGSSYPNDVAQAIAVDGSGNVFVTGYSKEICLSCADIDYATIKYSASGVGLWTNRYDVGNDDQAHAIAVDGSGNVFVTGYSYGLNSYFDYATIKYSSVGVPLWTNRYNGFGNGYDKAQALAVDRNGNVIVTGFSDEGSYNYVTIKYSGAGIPLWTNRYNGPGNSDDQPQAVAVDSSGNVFVTGYSYGIGSLSSDYATIKYSETGIPLWTNRYNGFGNNGNGNSFDSAQALAVDNSGNVFVTGFSTGTNGNYDYTTFEYSNTGIPLWTNHYNGPANRQDQPKTKRSLAIGPDGGVYVTGSSDSDQTGSSFDFATVKYLPQLTLHLVSQPINQSTYFGSNATFSASGYGTPRLSHQWLFEGTPLAGATNSLLIISNTTFGAQGNYRMVMTDANGSVTSSVATLTILDPPFINSQPASRTNVAGTTATFTVSASALGGSPVFYQWRRNGINLNAGNVSGAASGTLTLGNVQFNDAVSYSVMVSNNYGSVTSSVATLTVIPVITTTGVGSSDDSGRSMAVQSDNKIVVVGFANNGANNDFAVVRYNSNGTLDTNFNGTGKVITPIGTGDDTAFGVALQSDGKIVAVGRSNNGSNYDFGVVRYNTNGTLDTSFSTDGKLTTAMGTESDTAFGVAIQSDGKIVVSGRADTGTTTDFGVARYTTNGTLDTSFSSDGKLTTAIGTGNETGYCVAIQADGKIVVAGTSEGASNDDIAVARYTTNGTLDTTFSGDGKVTAAIGTGDDSGKSVKLQSDGNIVVAGDSHNGSNIDFAVVRFTTNGILDTSFNGTGKVTTAIGSGDDSADGMTLQDDGKILLAGNSYNGSNEDFAVVRYATNGILDTTFYGTGKVTTSIGSGVDIAYAVAMQSDGKIAVAGESHNGSNEDFALVLYESGLAPAITSHPLSQTNMVGSTVMFSVSATGASPLSYKWSKNGINLTDGGNISGSGTPTLTLTGIFMGDGGNYTVIISNSYSSTTSSVAVLTIATKAVATVTFNAESLVTTYDGTGKNVTATTSPSGLAVNFTYNGSANAPTNAGFYTVVGTVSDENYQGSITNQFVISPAPVTLAFESLYQVYDGSPKRVSVTITPFDDNGQLRCASIVGVFPTGRLIVPIFLSASSFQVNELPFALFRRTSLGCRAIRYPNFSLDVSNASATRHSIRAFSS